METHDDNELEQRMKTAFEPDAKTIDRIIVAAIRPQRRSGMLRVAVMLALAGIVLIAVLFQFQSIQGSAESIRMEYAGNVALIEFPDGSSLVVSPDYSDQNQTSCLSLIILEGDNP